VQTDVISEEGGNVSEYIINVRRRIVMVWNQIIF